VIVTGRRVIGKIIAIKQKFTETKGAPYFERGAWTGNVVYSPNIL